MSRWILALLVGLQWHVVSSRGLVRHPHITLLSLIHNALLYTLLSLLFYASPFASLPHHPNSHYAVNSSIPYALLPSIFPSNSHYANSIIIYVCICICILQSHVVAVVVLLLLCCCCICIFILPPVGWLIVVYSIRSHSKPSSFLLQIILSNCNTEEVREVGSGMIWIIPLQ